MTLPTPFAQGISIDPTINPDGVFIHSIDVCFAFKDDSLPITLQLRPIVDSFPSPSTVYYNAQATLYPTDIPTADGADVLPNFSDPTVYTRFVLASPCYLPPGSHAIVFQTASTQYFAFMAKTQDPLLGSTRVYSPQPNVGSLFRSQNSDAWSPYLDEAIMFRLNRCVFNVNTPSNVEFDVVAPLPTANVNVDTFQISVNDINFGKTGIEYSYESTDYFTGVLAPTPSTVQTNQNIYPADRQVITTQNNSFKVFSTMGSTTDYVSPILDPTRINVTGVENIINNGSLANNLFQITNPGALYNPTSLPTITISAPDDPAGTQALAAAVVTNNVLSNVVFSYTGTGYYTTPNVSVSVPGIVPSTNAVVVLSGETSTVGGNALVRYMTRKVVLNAGFDARDLQVYLTANRQPGTSIQVYYKVLSALDPDQNFANKSWARMVLNTNQNTYTPDNTSLLEYQWVSAGANQIPPVNITYANAGGTFTTFRQFAIKICLFSNSTTTVPFVKDLRGIALA